MFVSVFFLITGVLVGHIFGANGCNVDSPIAWGTVRLPRGWEILSLKDFDNKVCFAARISVSFDSELI